MEKIWYSQTDHRWPHTLKRCGLHDGWLRHEYRHTDIMCNNYCSSMANIATRTRLSFALYIHCLSCIVIRQSIHKYPKGISFRSPSYYYGCISYVSLACYSMYPFQWPCFDDCNSTWQDKNINNCLLINIIPFLSLSASLSIYIHTHTHTHTHARAHTHTHTHTYTQTHIKLFLPSIYIHSNEIHNVAALIVYWCIGVSSTCFGP